MSDYSEAEALRAEITRLIAVEKTLEEEFWALPEGIGRRREHRPRRQ